MIEGAGGRAVRRLCGGSESSGDLPFAQALPDERATAPLVLSTAPSPIACRVRQTVTPAKGV